MREPAVDPAPAARGDEDDPAVGKGAGIQVVVGAGGELAQPRAVGLDFIEVKLLGAALAPGKYDPAFVLAAPGAATARANSITPAIQPQTHPLKILMTRPFGKMMPTSLLDQKTSPYGKMFAVVAWAIPIPTIISSKHFHLPCNDGFLTRRQ